MPNRVNWCSWTQLLNAVRESEQPDLVVVADGREGERGAQFSDEFAFGLLVGAEALRATHVHDEHDGQLTLLAEFLDVRIARPRRHVPVDGADVVSGLIRADLLEFDASALEGRVVLTSEQFAGQPRGGNLDPPDLLEQFGGDHGRESVAVMVREPGRDQARPGSHLPTSFLLLLPHRSLRRGGEAHPWRDS